MTAFLRQYGDTLYTVVALTVALSPVILGALALSATCALLRYAFGKR